ncbi:MAG: M42 family metallopeptidase [Anaerolineae bacterium]|nr:M42 family metallopeptidase [Anaerolineae bacterium]
MLLKELVEADGVSGHEQAVREVLIKAIEGRADEYRVDALGNLIAVKYRRGHPGGGPERVMVAAHMDEVGLMVTRVERDGQVRFAPVGGVDPRVVVAKAVRIGDERIPGVIGAKPVHLLEPTERDRVLKFDQMAIDTGMSGDEAQRRIKAGMYVAFSTRFEALDEGGQRTVKGKAFDDRAGCAVLVELLDGSYSFDLYAAFTVQEEVGLRGARVAAYAVRPEVAFALEGTVCDDGPKEKDISPTTRLGAGPALTVMDRSVICDRRLVQMLIAEAEVQGIPYQVKQPGIGGTDAGAIHLQREGIPSAVLAVPARYIHSPVSVMSLNDLDNAVRLMRGALQRVQGGLGA